MAHDAHELPAHLRTVLSALQAREIGPAEAKEAIEALLSGRRRGANPLQMPAGPFPDMEDQHDIPPVPSAPPTISPAQGPETSTHTRLERELVQSIAETLYMDPAEVDPARAFVELGLDSILAAEWLRILNRRYGTSLPASRLYDYPNTRAMAQFLATQIAPEVPHALVEPLQSAPASTPAPASGERPPERQTERQTERHQTEPCAIIGISARYPRAGDLDEYWRNLEQGRNCVQPIPEARWDTRPYYDSRPMQTGKINCKWLGLLDDIASFDPLFFGIAPADAELMDPQHRIFLQEAYRAFEDAGYTPRALSGRKCGVYLGIMGNEYRSLLQQNGLQGTDTTGNSAAIAAGRIAYFLDLKGPAISIDTACSSSLVAIHLAFQALQRGEIDMALAGGVTLYLSPEPYLAMCGAGMLSPNGQCKTFDNSADGFVPGEGVGALVLKRLRDAEADGDRIYGVVIGSGINQDGKTNGMTAPSVRSQIELLRDVYRLHHIHPETISYVEAHGTGTKLGDPIELEALATVFKEATSRKSYCALGSVKSNIGHTSAAAGVAGVHKVLLAMKHQRLAPSLNFHIPNEHFDFADSPFFVNTEVRPWHSSCASPRRAAVSSFGFSGTNAHLVIEEYQSPEAASPPGDPTGPVLILLSAKNKDQLTAYATALQRHLIAQTAIDLRSVAYTLQTGRQAMDSRLAIIADSNEGLVSALRQFVEHGAGPGIRAGDASRISRGDNALLADEDAGVLLHSWLLKKKWNKLAKVWVEGVEIDWQALYPEGVPQRISLPTYPFAKEHCWLPAAIAHVPAGFAHPVAAGAAMIHPLLQENVSDINGLRFSTTFSGNEWFLADHKVQGRKMLPGVAYLEMARAAAAYAHGLLSSQDRSVSIVLKDVAFARPLVVEEARTVCLAIFDEERHAIRFEVASGEGDAREIYAQGWARIEPAEPGQVDLWRLRECCTRQISAESCYESLAGMGLDYGPAHRGIGELAAGTDEQGIPVVLAHLSLPAAATDKARQLSLHPSLLDSALQAGLVGLGNLEAPEPSLPFAVAEVIVFAPPPERCYSVVRPGAGPAPEGITQNLDVDICDEEGKVCVRINRFTSRRLQHSAEPPRAWPARRPEAGEGKPSISVVKDGSDTGLLERTTQLLRGLLATTAKLAEERVDADASLEQYGIDSIMILRLTSELEKSFGPLSKTLFFEYRTLAALAAYFLEAHRGRLQQLFPLGSSGGEPAAIEVTSAPNGRKVSRPAWLTRTLPTSSAAPSDIAIVGLSGRYPGAANVAEFWENLKAGRDCITEIPGERWDYRLYYDPEKGKPGKIYSKWGGFLQDVDCFDSLFFNISPREAQAMDPQERLFLECVYETLEDAGYTRETVGGAEPEKVGVFVGVMYDEYPYFGVQSQALGEPFANPGNPGSIANRVSYFCNFHGPSMAVDTMCSSSLTAIHLACQSLQRGECLTAVAGGVNVSIHANKYLGLSQGQFVSSKGRCESFGEGGDGYVPGEGVGAVLLKPLWRAEADGDHIYGVIKASALNHGGRTNGYSVPNPLAQAAVISQALLESGLPARTVTYMEAHGTGTSLGDPIEIAGLRRAFSALTAEKGFCAVGSAKSNIGHCESAAGIAGLTKVLLQIQHAQLAPSLHAERLNPHIEFAGSPFAVQRELGEWRRPRVGEREYPRIAGLSSFGAGGANAHMVISEHVAAQPHEEWSADTALIVVSAREQDRLRIKVEQLLAAIAGFGDGDLGSLAYTLQIGREAMDHRLAVSVHSIAELRHRLKRYLAGEPRIEDLHVGEVKRNQETLAVFTADEDLQAAIEAWVAKGKYAKLLALWVKGLVFDWRCLYPKSKPRRISLPTYPFARERHWVPRVVGGRRPEGLLHPLLHRNISDVNGLAFRSTFAGDEFFLADHVVDGRGMFPAVAYLEMARAAIEQAYFHDKDPSRAIVLRNVVFAEPLFGDQPAVLRIDLEEQEQAIAYRVSSVAGNREQVHAEGWAEIETYARKRLEIDGLLATCDVRIEARECYEIFLRMGLAYGPAHRGIEELQIGGAEGHGVVLARLSLPAAIASSETQFGLHPSLLDSALQSVVGLAIARSGDAQPSLPFAVEEAVLLAPMPKRCFALTRETQSSGLQKFDVDVCDEAGNVCAALRGLCLRPIERRPARAQEAANPSESQIPMTFEESLESEAAALPSEPVPASLSLICFLSDPEHQRSLREGLRRVAPGVRLAFIGRGDRPCTADVLQEIEARQGPVDAVFYLWAIEDRALTHDYATMVPVVQAVGRALPKCPRLLLAGEYGNDFERCSLESWIGFGRSLRLVLPETRVTVIAGEARNTPSAPLAEWPQRLWNEWRSPDGRDVVYEAGERFVYRLHASSPPQTRRQSILRPGGAYLVTGGAGGLGWLLAEYLVRKYSANLILTGRSPLSDAKQRRLRDLENSGAQILYVQADVCDRERMSHALVLGRERFGVLHGVIHAAGVEGGAGILDKSVETFEQVLAPKVRGTLVLDELLCGEALDFLCYFSSSSAILGDFGSCDYAVGNRFQMAWARQRNRLREQGKQTGIAIAINWPLWKEGGMGFREGAAVLPFIEWSGQRALETTEGLELFERLLAEGKEQQLVLAGQPSRLRQLLRLSSETVPQAAPQALAGPSGGALQERAVEYLRRLLGSALKLPSAQAEADAPLEQYGIDSILVLRLTGELEKSFGPLSKTLFFEYRTVAELAGYFARSHAGRLRTLLGLNETASAPNPILPAPPLAERKRPRAARPTLDKKDPFAVAIVGLSGRYPGAGSVAEFWQNLKAGRDCITEIPADRWDYRMYFDAEKGKPGKTYSKWGGFLEDVGRFDSLFFNISPAEAQRMDPQERLFLECVYATLEDAGYTRETVSGDGTGKVGVFAGVMYEEYQMYGAQAQVLGSGYALPGNPASIANRVSYYCNFHGPSMAVDTMCSSSLTAIHLACRSLERGECVAAIAGGVNLSVHPNKYLGLSQGQFVSSKGRCESFGEGGDGYVPGEGVGAVLLKPLKRAEDDGDHIYGVIKSSALNHGGKTNGYNVPNPQAQAAVISQALRESGLPARAVSYIEAHGTGTSLGDPIEMAGLERAFSALTDEKGFCALGSAKSNIGHCESAAGIAGLTKVLLQMQHGQLAPSLHAERLNPHIEFAESPFVVQRQLTGWLRPRVADREYPRIAGLSSFGAGGANAHMVISEYVSAEHADPLDGRPALIVLSARQPDRLLLRVEQLIDAIAGWGDEPLHSLAYTLQVGREAMEHRLALSVHSMAELRSTLQRYLAAEPHIEGLRTGEVKRNKEALSVFTADEDLQFAIEAWIAKGKYGKLLDLWVKGLVIDWSRLHGPQKRRRISLPTYPFAGERHWVPPLDLPAHGGQAWLHPLLQQNTSDLEGIRFTSRFHGEESFLADHVVQGQKMLPGVAYLEMARAAVEQVSRARSGAPPSGIYLRNALWVQPLTAGREEIAVHVKLEPKESGEIDYEISSHGAGVHAQGSAVLTGLPQAPAIDLSRLHSLGTQELSREECYAAFSAMGIEYGPAHRGIKEILLGSDQGRRFALAQVTLPAFSQAYVLHPGIMDCALQSSIALMPRTSSRLSVPFALDSLEVFRPCPVDARVLIQEAAGKLDFDICNDGGDVCVRLRGFTARPVDKDAEQTLLFAPCFEDAYIDDFETSEGEEDYAEHCVVLCELGRGRSSGLQALLPGIDCVTMESAAADIAGRFDDYVRQLLRTVQAILSRNPRGDVLLQVLIPTEGEGALFFGLAGLLKTARLEHAKLIPQVIGVEMYQTAEDLRARITENAGRRDDCVIRYDGGERRVERFQRVNHFEPEFASFPA